MAGDISRAAYIFYGICVILSIVLPMFYSYMSSASEARFPKLRNKRIALLIAHPDDEAMFFAPTVLALTRPDMGNTVKILCLSTGDADGLGETRRKELKKSAMLLGLKDENDVIVEDNPDFPDSMTITWDADRIAAHLSNTFATKQQQPGAAAGSFDIDTIVTFDSCGVSGHPNHISLYHGARAFLAAQGSNPAVDLYTLTSVNIARKYSSFIDIFATMFSARSSSSSHSHKKEELGESSSSSSSASTTPLPAAETLINTVSLFVSSGSSAARETYSAGRRAMVDAHKSQMVWFRWGWILLSRYMVVNDLRLERVLVGPGPEASSSS